MAEKTNLPPSGSGDSGEYRPAAPRTTGGYNDRPNQQPRASYGSQQPIRNPSNGSYTSRPQQPTRSSSSYGDRPQTPRSSGGGSYGARSQQPARSSSGYGDRPQPSRSSGSSNYGSRGAGSSGGRQSSSPRRVDVIRCENCGEDYNVSYKRCPFCDERPGRGGISGKRVSNTRGGGYGRPVNPVQIAGLVISLVLIASALFIVFRFIGAPLFNKDNRKPNGSSDVSTSQNSPPNTTPAPSTSSPQTVQSITLNNTDFSLESGGTYQLSANLLPVGATGDVSWSSSDATVATVDAAGLVTNLNAGTSDAVVNITATCNGVSAQTSVTCKAKTPSGGSSGGTVSSGATGRIVNADKGLNIRSGPGKNYEVVASAKNGASVTILGEENGFYKVYYSGTKIGYVSKDYVSVG